MKRKACSGFIKNEKYFPSPFPLPGNEASFTHYGLLPYNVLKVWLSLIYPDPSSLNG
jgi:hypothetical protein